MTRTLPVQKPDTTGNRAKALVPYMRAFNRRRCWCGKPATSVRPGRDGIPGILPTVKDENFCLDHCFVAAKAKAA